MEIQGDSGGFAPWAPIKALPWTHWGGLQHPRTQAETEFLEDLLLYFILLFYFIRLSFGKIYCFVL